MIENRRDNRIGGGEPIHGRVLAWTVAYGAVFDALLSVVLGKPALPYEVRALAFLALIAIWVFTARGSFSRWMAPGDGYLVGGPLAERLGGPGRQPFTPDHAAYLGAFFLSFVATQYALGFFSTDRTTPLIFMLVGVGLLAYGLIADRLRR